MTLSAGTRLGTFEILASLGAGGMGEVYRARDMRLDREVALKVLPEEFFQDEERRLRFEREARTLATLNHPGIAAIYSFEEVPGSGSSSSRHLLVMELVEGEDLGQKLLSGPISPEESLSLARQIAEALEVAHEKGIVHRDLKPANVKVTPDGKVKLLDFGLAKVFEADPAVSAPSATRSPTLTARATAAGVILGTAAYMSPEQARGKAVDRRTDIWAWGCVLYEMLTGKKAFKEETVSDTIAAVLTKEPDWSALPPGIPERVRGILRKCLRGDARQRLHDIADARLDLEESGLFVPPASPRSIGVGLRIGVAALVVTAAVGGYFFRSARPEPRDPEWGEATLTRLTTDPGYEGEPTFSPDGQTIAYVADRDGNFEIYLQQISGGPALNLTRNPAADIQPAFSPDGREIAFVSNRTSSSDVIHAAPGLPLVGGDIWVMPALGGPARRIVENGNFPSWTPDGTGILYVHGTFRNTRIARVPSTGGESRDLPIDEPFVFRYFHPSVSGDGRWLLYQNGNQVEVVEARGGKPRILELGESPAWGSDSATILFTSGTPGKGRTLWEVPFSPGRGELVGQARPLTFGRGADLGGKASRDGSVVAFCAVDDTLNLEEISFDAEAGRVTGPPRALTSGNNSVGFFDPSPDGQAVVFGAERGADSRLWRVDPPAAPIQLTREPGYSDGNPEWSPDGREIAFVRTETGNAGATPRFVQFARQQALWIMRADGSSPRRVTENSGQVAWLPGGTEILVQRGDGVMRVELASGAAAPVAGARARNIFSVDGSGTWLVYQYSEGGPVGLEAVPVGGGTPRAIVTAPFEAYHPFFSPSGRWLYFQPNHKNVFRVPGPAQNWTGAPPQKVTDFSGFDLYIEDPKISRDGKKLFYTRGRRTGDIFILQRRTPAPKKGS